MLNNICVFVGSDLNEDGACMSGTIERFSDIEKAEAYEIEMYNRGFFTNMYVAVKKTMEAFHYGE